MDLGFSLELLYRILKGLISDVSEDLLAIDYQDAEDALECKHLLYCCLLRLMRETTKNNLFYPGTVYETTTNTPISDFSLDYFIDEKKAPRTRDISLVHDKLLFRKRHALSQKFNSSLQNSSHRVPRKSKATMFRPPKFSNTEENSSNNISIAKRKKLRRKIASFRELLNIRKEMAIQRGLTPPRVSDNDYSDSIEMQEEISDHKGVRKRQHYSNIMVVPTSTSEIQIDQGISKSSTSLFSIDRTDRRNQEGKFYRLLHRSLFHGDADKTVYFFSSHQMSLSHPLSSLQAQSINLQTFM